VREPKIRVKVEPIGEDELRFTVLPEETADLFMRAAVLDLLGGRARVDRRGRVTITAVEVGDEAGLSTASLRSVPLGLIREEIARTLAGLEQRQEQPQTALSVDEAVAALIEAPPTRGRGADRDGFLAAVADAYLAAAADAPAAPVLDLHSRLKRTRRFGSVGLSTLTGWIHQARARGWLERAVQGRSAPRPGPRLIEQWNERREGGAK
jgi:hypothetical protein